MSTLLSTALHRVFDWLILTLAVAYYRLSGLP